MKTKILEFIEKQPHGASRMRIFKAFETKTDKLTIHKSLEELVKEKQIKTSHNVNLIYEKNNM